MHWGVKGAKHSVSKESKHLEKERLPICPGEIFTTGICTEEVVFNMRRL